jgi:hypothetical protein
MAAPAPTSKTNARKGIIFKEPKLISKTHKRPKKESE